MVTAVAVPGKRSDAITTPLLFLQVAQTLHSADFRKLVGTTMTERRERLLMKRGLFVSTAPEIAEAIARTQLFSCKFISRWLSFSSHVDVVILAGSKGKAPAMVAGSRKRKRGVDDNADELMSEMEKGELAELQQQNEDLKKQMTEMQKLLISKNAPKILL